MQSRSSCASGQRIARCSANERLLQPSKKIVDLADALTRALDLDEPGPLRCSGVSKANDKLVEDVLEAAPVLVLRPCQFPLFPYKFDVSAAAAEYTRVRQPAGN